MPETGDDRELLVWPHGDMSQEPERWVRTGACRRCGACCERTERPHYLMGLMEEDAPEEAGAAEQGPDVPMPEAPEAPPSGPVSAERWDGHWTFWQATLPRPGGCPQWRGEGVCAVYGAADFPDVCRKWPVFPAEMDGYPTCGFHFRRVE